MATTNPKIVPYTNSNQVNDYYTQARDLINIEDIESRYDAIAKQMNANLERQIATNENAFYRNMYNTHRTAMDTIRNSNAQAVATGASRGMQAATNLATILGLGDSGATAATELAQTNESARQDNALQITELNKAKEQDINARVQALITSMIEQDSINKEREVAQLAAEQAAAEQAAKQVQEDRLLQAAATSPEAYYTAISQLDPESQKAYIPDLINQFNIAATVYGSDFKGSNTAANKASTLIGQYDKILTSQGLEKTELYKELEAMFNKKASDNAHWLQGVEYNNSANYNSLVRALSTDVSEHLTATEKDKLTNAIANAFNIKYDTGKDAYARLVGIYQRLLTDELNKILAGKALYKPTTTTS